MKITIFGATGGTGKELVNQALEKKHEVTVFVRDPLKVANKKVRIVHGDVRDGTSVIKAVKGADAILSALGVKPGQKPVCAQGMKNIIAAMESEKVRRLIVVSVYGAGTPRAGFYAWLLRKIIPRLMKDKKEMERIIAASGLSWTIVTPTVLTMGAKTGKVRHGTSFIPRGLFPSVSRADVAGFMLSQIGSLAYVQKIVNMSA